MMNMQWSIVLIVLSTVQIYTTYAQCPAGFDACPFVQCGQGTCVSNNTLSECFQCQCDVGYTGKTCDTQINAQSGCSSPCQNGGQCQQVTTNVFACTCPPELTGPQCETVIAATHICVTAPTTACLNGGSCVLNGQGFACNCAAGWMGTKCETRDANPLTTCTPNACGAHGNCTEAILPSGGQIAVCICENSYSGQFCQINLGSACPQNICQNGGICSMNGNVPTCSCPQTHTGATCETLVSILSSTTPGTEPVNCASNPCLNGGTCYDNGNSFVCYCRSGSFTGRRCETPISTGTTPLPGISTTTVPGNCDSRPCLNGGVCYNNGNSFYCYCKQPYSGLTCNVQGAVTTVSPLTTSGVDACASNPCNNGGKCYKHASSFVCLCTSAYTGLTCDTVKIPTTTSPTGPSSTVTCANQPCQNGGTCYNAGNSYFCYCGASSNFSGKNCDTPKIASDSSCPLDCSSGHCIRTGNSNNPYACMCNGVLTPTSCSS